MRTSPITTFTLAFISLFMTGHLASGDEPVTLTVDTIGKGSVTVFPQKDGYECGEQVTLTTTPEEGHAFVGWDGDWFGQKDEITLTVEADMDISAEFGEIVEIGSHQYAFGEAEIAVGTRGVDESPYISSDGLSLYFSAGGETNGQANFESAIHVATRESPGDPWGEPVNLMEGLPSTGIHHNFNERVSIPTHGLSLFYETVLFPDPSSEPTQTAWHTVTRASLDAPFDFDQAKRLGESIQTHNDIGPGAITRDGTGFVLAPWSFTNHVLYHAPFDPNTGEIGELETMLTDPNERLTQPELSSDGLALFFQRGTIFANIRLYAVTRETLHSEWSEPVRLPSHINKGVTQAPSIDPALTTLYFAALGRTGSTPSFPPAPPGDIWQAKMRRLPASPPPSKVTINTVGNGAVRVSPDLESFEYGSEITLTALPDEGHALVGWGGDAIGQEDEMTLTIENDLNITAEFGEIIEIGAHQYVFGQPDIAVATQGVEENPYITNDGLSLYFSTGGETNGQAKWEAGIQVVTREHRGAPWGAPVNLMDGLISSGVNHNWNFMTGVSSDSLTLYYLTVRFPNVGVFSPSEFHYVSVSRDNTALPFDFSTADEADDSFSIIIEGGAGTLTRDGLGMVYGDAGQNLYYAPFDADSKQLGEPEVILSHPNRPFFPELSEDGLALIFELDEGNQKHLYLATRESPTSPWSAPVKLPSQINRGDLNLQASMDSNLTTLYYASDMPGSTPSFPPASPRDIWQAKMRRLPVSLTFDFPVPGGFIETSPSLERYPIGTQVTITAIAEEGYQFVEWTGEAAGSANPLTLVVSENTMIAPVFAKMDEPQPLQVDIAPAVVVSWDSQLNKVYQIQTSIDMETWEVVADGIEGTGERLTHCFTREETEVFYRVEESP